MFSALGTDQVAAEILIRRKLKGTAVIPDTEKHKLWKPQPSPLQKIAGDGNKTGHSLLPLQPWCHASTGFVDGQALGYLSGYLLRRHSRGG
ncbi:MAG: hypothetical protein M3N42_06560 [Cyanobacteriota bacterium]|nr:hypothetical protein [Cyanobacteriota bacterium]